MANQITVARDLFIGLWRGATVATAAGIGAVEWASTDESTGHVFDLVSIGVLNKGRLPIVRCIFSNDSNDYTNSEGGMASISFDVEVVVGGVSNKTNIEVAEAIMSAGENAVRNSASRYWDVMQSSSSQMLKGAMSTTLTRNFIAELTWSNDSV